MKSIKQLVVLIFFITNGMYNTQLFADKNAHSAEEYLNKLDQERAATMKTLEEFAKNQPEAFAALGRDEGSLKKNFESIEHFLNKKIKEIKKLIAENSMVSHEIISRLRTEIDHAQNLFEKLILKGSKKINFDTHKKKIEEELIKAKTNLEKLAQNESVEEATTTFNDTIGYISNQANKALHNISEGTKNTYAKVKKSKASRSIAKASSDAYDYVSKKSKDLYNSIM